MVPDPQWDTVFERDWEGEGVKEGVRVFASTLPVTLPLPQ